MTTATAPGKIILFGEHSVVYGHPAIAMPIQQVCAKAIIEPANSGIELILPDLGMRYWYGLDAVSTHPLLQAIGEVEAFCTEQIPPLTITLKSTIPIASGLGSGAATSAALIRTLLRHLGNDASDQTVCRLTYHVEKLHHGTPSGIDNTVIAYEQPVYFVRHSPENRIEPFKAAQSVRLLIADTGMRSKTKAVVEDVRRQWLRHPTEYRELFARCGNLARVARVAIAKGARSHLGTLMTQNHALLQKIDVSSPQLDRLVEAAQHAGALGAKLSGAGRGGNMIALVTKETEQPVFEALYEAGATSVLRSI